MILRFELLSKLRKIRSRDKANNNEMLLKELEQKIKRKRDYIKKEFLKKATIKRNFQKEKSNIKKAIKKNKEDLHLLQEEKVKILNMIKSKR